ncbi:GGDEF domain-containing protein [Acidithiobacillus sp. AMEEHan]|uniref:GGDEF domain-containing protein n=1 Tax=Acidithiobacillus sp. AMEEHan TaxID=2994951 RepID=UPI0027E48337|nr:GGDEF domain-containing protein [Acidithiobacillus sp. AMEEHan]
MEKRSWQKPKSLQLRDEGQDIVLAALDRLINAWNVYWSAWLDQMDTREAEQSLLRALHDPEPSLREEDRRTWSMLEQACHALLHELRADASSKNRHDLCDRTLLQRVSRFQNDCWNALLQRQRAQSEADALTGLANRRRLAQDLRRQHSMVQRGAAACVAIVDLDHFKAFNDQHGHLAGDQALRILADFLRSSLRPYDGVYRFGGEEFILILPGMTESCALRTANRLCEHLLASRQYFDDGRSFGLSISIGIAALTADSSYETALAAADAALYQAKAEGRGRAKLGVVRASEKPQPAVSSR